jgi:hypothetical protein
MKNPALLAVVCVFCCALFCRPAFAGNGRHKGDALVSVKQSRIGPLHEVWHYIDTHKELLASDAIIIAAWSADAASTINDQHNCPTCVETNPILGPHPTEDAIWLYASGWSAFQTTLNHLAWHYAPDPVLRHMVWIPTVITGINELPNVQNNVRWAEAKSTFSVAPSVESVKGSHTIGH